MSKITRNDIIGPKGLGFIKEMYTAIVGNEDQAFADLVDSVITEKAAELEGRIGSVIYNDTAEPNVSSVRKAERCLTAAEMIQRRINIVLAQPVGPGQEMNTVNERKQRQDYLDQAEVWIGKLAQGVTTDSASGDFGCRVVSTSHFGENTA